MSSSSSDYTRYGPTTERSIAYSTVRPATHPRRHLRSAAPTTTASTPGICRLGNSAHRGRFALSLFDGGHFYLNDHLDAVARGECRCPITTRSSIVGMAVEAPGGVDTTEDYWDVAVRQRRGAWAVSHRSWLGGFASCWKGRGAADSRTSTTLVDSCPVRRHSTRSSFGISPREATAMDPQQRVALRLAWRTGKQRHQSRRPGRPRRGLLMSGASAIEYGPATFRVLPPQWSSDQQAPR